MLRTRAGLARSPTGLSPCETSDSAGVLLPIRYQRICPGEDQWGRQSDGEGLSLAIEEEATSTAVGLIALLFRPEPLVAGVGYWVIPEARGRRFAARAVALLAPWALQQASVRRLEALVDPENLASMPALEGCGFQKEGLLRSYLKGKHDAFIYSLLPTPRSRSPRPQSPRTQRLPARPPVALVQELSPDRDDVPDRPPTAARTHS